MRRLVLLPLVVTVLAVAGCGSDDTASTTSTPAASTSTPAAAAPAPAGKAVEIGMEGLQFAPKDVTVKVGATVTWKNLEDIPHNVTAQDGADFKSDDFGKGGTFEYKAEKAGTIAYVCTIHPGMEGKLTVTE